jgi:hypothetical protein
LTCTLTKLVKLFVAIANLIADHFSLFEEIISAFKQLGAEEMNRLFDNLFCMDRCQRCSQHCKKRSCVRDEFQKPQIFYGLKRVFFSYSHLILHANRLTEFRLSWATLNSIGNSLLKLELQTSFEEVFQYSRHQRNLGTKNQ